MADWDHRDCTATHCFWLLPSAECRHERIQMRMRKMLPSPQAVRVVLTEGEQPGFVIYHSHIPSMQEMQGGIALSLTTCETLLDQRIANETGQPCSCGQMIWYKAMPV